MNHFQIEQNFRNNQKKKKNKENREKEEEIGAKIDRLIDNFPDK